MEKAIHYAAELYDLRIGEKWKPSDYSQYLRVPGGWVYENWDDNSFGTTIFIPYSDEFKRMSEADV